MLKYILMAALLSAPAYPQSRAPAPYQQPPQLEDEFRTPTCKVRVPEKFRCAILFDLGFADPGNIIASVTGGSISQLSLISGGTIYTVVYDPPLRRDDKFSALRRRAHIPVQIDGDDLIVQWPDGTRAKGRIVRREPIHPDRPRPA